MVASPRVSVQRVVVFSATLGLILSLILFIPGNSSAKVTGACSNCHTMHYSQDGTQLSDWGSSGPYQNLTIDNCIGCHSATDATTFKDPITGAPIVYNIAEPATPLAGGNFYWVVAVDDSYGHNVRGISPKDSKLGIAPGGEGHTCASWSCHGSLTYPDTEHGGRLRKNGCEGCHNTVKHHGDDSPGEVVGADGGWYRFLCGDHGPIGGGGVAGIEDPDWEQNPTSARHNSYYGVRDKEDHWDEPQAMSDYCSGCHQAFHSPGWWADNGGEGNPWLRHPSDWTLPASGEYTAYTVYDPSVPVARPHLPSPDPAAVTHGDNGDMVMCLSCHRTHGSPYPDMLRWDYSTIDAGGGESGGCFTCHTSKN